MFGKDTAAELENLRSQISDMQSERMALDAQLEDYRNTVEGYTADKAKYTTQLKSYTDQIDNLKAIHAEQIKSISASVNRQVNTALASVGVNVFANENFTVATAPTDSEALVKFQSLSGNEKTVYYNKHKDAITRALLAK